MRVAALAAGVAQGGARARVSEAGLCLRQQQLPNASCTLERVAQRWSPPAVATAQPRRLSTRCMYVPVPSVASKVPMLQDVQ
eukprot:38788-Chlamydomonas_euryale.AAC.1